MLSSQLLESLLLYSQKQTFARWCEHKSYYCTKSYLWGTQQQQLNVVLHTEKLIAPFLCSLETQKVNLTSS